MELLGILAFVVALLLSVMVHEFGHYLAARFFKIRVEKFYLFFNPWFSLVKKKIGDTEWGIGWLPLGGYVKIAGMVDESMDKEQMAQPIQPWEFRAKPAWQRLIIMLGGVTVNLFLGIFIYSMTLYTYGDKYLPNENIKDGISQLQDYLRFSTSELGVWFNGKERVFLRKKEKKGKIYFEKITSI